MSAPPMASPTQVPKFATFGEMLRFLRRRARMTQTELSIAVGYSVSQISRLEQDERTPDPATLLAVFVPALGLENEPETTRILLDLAQVERSERIANTAAANPQQNFDTPANNNLPLRLTSFIGRTPELNALAKRIISARLVTLLGPGGVGKTSLAVESARLAEFRDGKWLVELAAIQEEAQVAKTIAAALRLPDLPGRSAIEALLTYCQNKELLLLLDNCEHLIATCAELVERLLRACPKIHILATSRESLGVDGEIEWIVAPLRTPNVQSDEQKRLTISELRDFEAIDLFLERACAIKPDLVFTERNAPTIVSICTHLDGIPLALELAAARLTGLTVEELAERLQDRFSILTGGKRTALPRHQTLRATIEWSYNLLSEPEKTLLRRLAVFVDGWTISAAEAMVEEEQIRKQTLTLLLQLVNKSLVIADNRGIETRYRMLETIRQYALEKLQEAGEEEHEHRRHFDYFLSLAEQSHDFTLIGPRLSLWMNQIAAEWNNLRSAFVWSRGTIDVGERQLRLAGALGLFWHCRAGYDQGIAWLEESLTHESHAAPTLRAIVLSLLANLSRRVGSDNPHLIESAQEIFTQANHRYGLGYCLVLKAITLELDAATFEQSLLYHQQALQHFREIGYLLFTGYMLAHVAEVSSLLKQNESAIQTSIECLEFGRKYEEKTIVTWALNVLSTVDRRRAIALCQEELIYQRTQNDHETLATILETLGQMLQKEALYQEALPLLEECMRLWRILNIKFSMAGGIARAALDLGQNHFWMGNNETAAIYMKEAAEVYGEVGDVHGVAWAQMMLGNILLRQQKPDEALIYLRASLQHSLDIGMNYLPLTFVGIGQAKNALGDKLTAAHFFGVATRYEDKLHLIDLRLHKDFVDLLTSARATLTDIDCTIAWEAGRQMSLEEAVKLL